jgi:Ser/Thr protein kinase RdoA (MazF antagonist)
MAAPVLHPTALPPRPMASAALLQAVVQAYALPQAGKPIDLGGSSNLNLHLPAPDGGHVIRVYRAWVSPERLSGIQSVRAALRRAGLPFTQTIPAADGRPWIRFGDWLVEVEPFVAGGDMDAGDQLLEGLRLLGRIHAALSRVEVPHGARRAPVANHVEAADALETTLRACAAIRSWASSPAERRVATVSEELARALRAAGDQAVGGRLPRQLVHGDFWDNNVKFRDGSLVAVLDLDFMGERARIDDVALILYYVNSGSTLASVHDPAARMRALRRLVDAYDSGLERHLSDAERSALPLALARTPLKYARHLLLREEAAAQRAVAMAEAPDLEWALRIARRPGPWQDAFR